MAEIESDVAEVSDRSVTAYVRVAVGDSKTASVPEPVTDSDGVDGAGNES